MKHDVWRWLSEGRPGGVARACARLCRQGVALLEIPTPEAEQLLRRVTTMERDIVLPVKAACLVMLLFPFFHDWIKQAMGEMHVDVQEWTRYFLWYYLPANVVIAWVLLALRRLPLGLVQWVVFVSGLLDVILLSALTVFTTGYQSFSYWLFLALVVRSAVSVPRATSQLALHFTIITCYVIVGLIQVDVVSSLAEEARGKENEDRAKAYEAYWRGRRQATTNTAPAALKPSVAAGEAVSPPQGNRPPAASPAARSRTSSALAANWKGSAQASRSTATALESPAEPLLARPGRFGGFSGDSGWLEGPAEPLLVRLTLLLLMSVCSYGLQVLLERQRKGEEEAREFALREGQLHAAGRLAAEFAHQIKNPLAVINNAAYSLQRALKQGRSVGAEQIQIIQEEVERSDRIITEIMGYAQLSEGRVEKVSVIEELEHAIERVFPPAAGYPIQIHREYGPEFPPLLMLRRHVSETFLNLLQNAREALDGQGGQVFVRALCHSDHSIEVSIGDNGPGIPADKREQIFEAYYTTKAKGTGLGLATVKHNVELYGGTVRVESELGKGARFVLIFPARTLMKLAQQT